MKTRIERDSLGEIPVPADALYGAQTARALINFPVSGIKPHPLFIWATVAIKKAAATVNKEMAELKPEIADAIIRACDEVLDGKYSDQFVVDVIQAGAGTSHNMNVNEVLANRANEILGGKRGGKGLVHPNDHVNRGQSTNDVIPTAIRLCSLRQMDLLCDALMDLASAFHKKSTEFHDILKSGRTHLQDAVPIRLGSEFRAWQEALANCCLRLYECKKPLGKLGIGGNAVGSGVNTPKNFPTRMASLLAEQTGLELDSGLDLYERTQSLGDFSHLSGLLRTVALELTRIANDIRLLASGPNTGLAEIVLPPVQPGSSIMPGKVNPVMAEMLNMVCFQVCGADTTIAMAAQAGQLELNVMMPVIAYNLSFAFTILTNAVKLFTERCVLLDWEETLASGETVTRHGIAADAEACAHFLERSTGLATLLNPAIGYDAAAEVMKQAKRERKSIKQVVVERKLMSAKAFDELIRRSVER